MIKAFLVAFPLCIMNLSEAGMSIAALYMFTGMMCWQNEFTRSLMIGFYIVGGFWYMAGSSM